jgi:hypothetical protein
MLLVMEAGKVVNKAIGYRPKADIEKILQEAEGGLATLLFFANTEQNRTEIFLFFEKCF